MTTPRRSTLIAGAVFVVAGFLYIAFPPPLTSLVSTSPIPVYVVTSTVPPTTVPPTTSVVETTTNAETTDTSLAEPMVTSTTNP